MYIFNDGFSSYVKYVFPSINKVNVFRQRSDNYVKGDTCIID